MKINRINLYIALLKYFVCSTRAPKKSSFLNSSKTVEEIIAHRKSLIRIGDGEFDILEGKPIHYQRYDTRLAEELDNIIVEFIQNPEKCKYLIGMPNKYIAGTGWKLLKRKVLLTSWAHTRYSFQKKYDKDVTYYDAFLFGRGKEKIYQDIWMSPNIDNIIFVHNDSKYAKFFSEKYHKNTCFVKVPAEDAFEDINGILNEIVKCPVFNLPKTQILVSAGPAGKILVYRLTQMGAWVIDTGHCWDEPLTE